MSQLEQKGGTAKAAAARIFHSIHLRGSQPLDQT